MQKNKRFSQAGGAGMWIIIIIVIAVIGWVYWRYQTPSGDAMPPTAGEGAFTTTPGDDSAMPVPPADNGGESIEPPADETQAVAAEITYTDGGYEPATVTISAGETVVFHNESSGPMWTASAVHPTHRVYPGSDINKCGGAEANAIFDACTGIPTGESWAFTFDEVGEWFYHNHLLPAHTGRVVVQ